ncbi:hypothetical protein AAFF_G00431480 [Aldrovandia affinis]|uniref:Transcriptional-regulating factor 1 n=1 Tax=Aldrovandia affinis TaxID=143900 RepID=A0AAD7S8P5_9TELE|nr:hypothetical protein AAFF_G00431480 [Aldrovandia affinis]
MAKQPFYQTPPAMGNYFPQQDPTLLNQSYDLPGSSTKLPYLSSNLYQHPSFPAPETHCPAGPGPSRTGAPWLSLPEKNAGAAWASQPAEGAPEASDGSSLQRLDSFTHAFASHNLRMFTSSTPSLDPPLLSSLTTPSDAVHHQLLSHKPQLLQQGLMQTQAQPMGLQQECPEMELQPMRSYDQMQPHYGYLQQQDEYCLQQETYYHLHPHQNTHSTHSTHPPNIHSIRPHTHFNHPDSTHSTHPHTHSTQQPTLSPPFPSHYSQICNVQSFSQTNPAHSIPQTHFYYQNPHQNPHQNQQQNQHQSSFHVQQQQVQLQEDSQSVPRERYHSDSSCLTLLSPVDPDSAPYQPLPVATTHSPGLQGEKTATQHQQYPPSTPQWPQMCLSIQEGPPCPDHRAPVRLMERGGTARLLCSICQKEFKSLPALNGHMRSHRGGTTTKTTGGTADLCQEVDPVSMPVQLQPTSSRCPLWPHQGSGLVHLEEHSLQLPVSDGVWLQAAHSQVKMGRGSGVRPEKRSRPRPELLIIPSPSPTLSPGALCCTGLFSSIHMALPTHPNRRVLLSRTSSMDGSTDMVTQSPGEKLLEIRPRINIGPCFQAAIPEVKRPSHMDRDTHSAVLLWSPLGGQERPAKQKVEDLLNMACSSVLPGGGTNAEYALHCLYECKGNLMATLERLLLQRPQRRESNHLVDYHYAGSDNWTLVEKKQLNKAFIVHNKDFFLIQKMVKTKTVAQCVEYYYTWKKRLRLGKKPQAQPERGVHTPKSQDKWEEELQSVVLDDIKQVKANWSPDLEDPVANQIAGFACEIPACGSIFSSRQALNGHTRIHGSLGPAPKPLVERIRSRPAPGSHSPSSGDIDPAHVFPCKECGKVFLKIKSRNAHMKTHRQHEDPQPWLLHEPQISLVGAPEGHQLPLPEALLPLAFEQGGFVKPLCEEEEEEEEGEGDSFLPAHPLFQMEAGKFIPEEEL